MDPDALTKLDRFQAVALMQKDGRSLPAFTLSTPPPLPKPEDAAERSRALKERSREALLERGWARPADQALTKPMPLGPPQTTAPAPALAYDYEDRA
jgi:hypothetical protein